MGQGNNATLLVGDLHGRYEIAEAALAYGSPVVFMGDYLDSWDRSVKDQVYTLLTVLNATEDRDDVTALMGNHERSYLFRGEECSGRKVATEAHVLHLKERMLNVLQDYTYVHGYLVSHAGISKHFLDGLGITLDDYLQTGKFNDVGRVRGGTSAYGGLYWCDWFHEFEPLEYQPQIVGHSGWRPSGSQGIGVLQKGNSWLVDTFEQKQEVLLVHPDKEPEIIAVQDL